MTGSRLSPGDDLLVHQLPRPVAAVEDDARSWFDRLYFCLHPPSGAPIVVVGAGVYPNVGLIDGYACVATGEEQRNLRFSDRLGPDRLRSEVGPLRWEVVEPLRRWRLVVDDNPQGVLLDAVYTARSEPWLVEPIAVSHEKGPQTEFAHFFQCGRWAGSLELDGERYDLDGWIGARDRSWGVRRTRELLGLHMWVVAQLEDACVAVHYNEYRDGRQHHCGGAVMRDGAEPVPVTSLGHELVVDEGGELLSARFEVPAGDEVLRLECEGLHRGLYMAAAGYGGWHGQDHGPDTLEDERWVLDGSQTPRSLSLGLVDKVCRFTLDDLPGAGMVELALSRSASYGYRPRRLGEPR